MGRIRDIFRPRPPVFSLVAAAYNVASYIDEFFASIIAQTYGVAGVELIVVNDGSTDETGFIIDQWVKRYPKLIRCIHQENGGVAAARNAGMAVAKGVWIGFPDPDDILHPDYLAQLAQVIDPADTQVALVANLIRYVEETRAYTDTHPMRYRFKKGVVSRPVHKTRDMILQSVSHAVFRRASIVAHQIRFDQRVRPTFEDGHFANVLLVHEAARIISFVPDAVYFYRKRAALSSAVDGSRDDPRWYTTQIETGYLSLIALAQKVHGHVPVFIQVNCVYSMLWRFRYLVDYPDRAAILDDPSQAALCRNLELIFAHVAQDVIVQFRCAEVHKVALLARYGKGRRDPLRIQPVHLSDNLYEFHWCAAPDEASLMTAMRNGKPVQGLAPTQKLSFFLDQPYVRQDSLQLRVTAGDTISMHSDDGRQICFRDRGLDMGPQITAVQLAQLRPVPVVLAGETAQNG